MNDVSPFASMHARPRLQDALSVALSQLAGESLPPTSLPAAALLQAALGGTNTSDARLLSLCHTLDLSQEVLMAVTLCAALEQDPKVAAQLRQIQGDSFGAWPAVATLAKLMHLLGQGAADCLPDLGQAFSLGLLIRVGERSPGPEERFALSPAMLAAMNIPSAENIIAPIGPNETPAAWQTAAAELANRVQSGTCLVLRIGEEADKLAFAAAIATASGKTAIDISGGDTGVGIAARFANWLPVSVIKTSLGSRSPLPRLPGYSGVRIAVIDADGGLAAPPEWQLVDVALPAPLPQMDPLWNMGPSRRRAVETRIAMQPAERPASHTQRAALGAEYRASMEPHAQLVPEIVAAEDFVAADETHRDLDILIARCRYALSGQSTRTKGVKSLLSGPSGTGKTLAASYLSSMLGLPLFRLDLSAVVSKYIGETEENLSSLLDHAESGHLVLLMDEADSLFAGRTDVTDSAARFANNQTNFLLTRFENFGGIAILTSNSPERFDKAFARRLDQVIDVQTPAAPQRRAILRRNLRDDHALSNAEINRISGLVDLSGGHLRNIVHTARVLAAGEKAPITFGHISIGIDQEYRKIGRQAPSEFSR